MTPEQKARVSIDALLQQAGWHVCDVSSANIHAVTGGAIREFPLNSGFGFADYLLYVNGKAWGVIETKKEGATFTGVELQSGRYAQGLHTTLPAWRQLRFNAALLFFHQGQSCCPSSFVVSSSDPQFSATLKRTHEARHKRASNSRRL